MYTVVHSRTQMQKCIKNPLKQLNHIRGFQNQLSVNIQFLSIANLQKYFTCQTSTTSYPYLELLFIRLPTRLKPACFI